MQNSQLEFQINNKGHFSMSLTQLFTNYLNFKFNEEPSLILAEATLVPFLL